LKLKEKNSNELLPSLFFRQSKKVINEAKKLGNSKNFLNSLPRTEFLLELCSSQIGEFLKKFGFLNK
jgi:hypothetical protein